MSDYFIVKESIDSNVIGSHYPQCTGVLNGYNNEYINKKSLYYFAHQKGVKVKNKPDLSSIKVGQRTKMTDIISCSLGPGNDMVVSDKLFSLIKKAETSNIQFFDCLLHKKEVNYKYNWVHFVYNLEEFVDYKKSVFFHPNEKILAQAKEIKDYKSFLVFYNEMDTYGFIKTEKTFIRHPLLDFFTVGRFNQKHYVSSEFKSKLLSEGLSGIEFEAADDIVFV